MYDHFYDFYDNMCFMSRNSEIMILCHFWSFLADLMIFIDLTRISRNCPKPAILMIFINLKICEESMVQGLGGKKSALFAIYFGISGH